jgi:hypothetical protein
MRAIDCYVSFHHCNQNTQEKQLKEERFIWAQFQMSQSWSLDFVTSGPGVVSQNIMAGNMW